MDARVPLIVALALAAGPARAIDTDDPVRLVGEIYQHYQGSGPGFDIHGADAPDVLTKDFASLVKRDASQPMGEVGALDFDPFCACQDFKITNVRTTMVSGGDDHEVVRVDFANFGKPVTLTITLDKGAQGWRINDIGSHNVPSVMDLLRSSLD